MDRRPNIINSRLSPPPPTNAVRITHLQDKAVAAVLLLLVLEESRTSGILEYFTDTFARLGRTFEIVLCTNLLCDSHALHDIKTGFSKKNKRNHTHLFRSHGSLIRLPQLVDHTWVTSKILLTSNENNGQTSTEMHDLRNPLKIKIRTQVRRVVIAARIKRRRREREKTNLPSPERCRASRESRLQSI